MTWRFRRTVRLLPGVRLNFSKSGISASIGVAPFTVNLSSRGVMGTLGLPGTGLSARTHISSTGKPLGDNLPAPPHFPIERAEQLPTTEIKSAAADIVTSDGLTALLTLLKEAQAERQEIRALLGDAEESEGELSTKYWRWEHGFLWRRIMPKRFARLGEEAKEAANNVAELKAQLKQAVIATEIEAPAHMLDRYGDLRRSFEALRRASAIWDTISERQVDRRAERSSASREITRERVQFELGRSEILGYPEDVPILHNRNGGDLLIYPGFVLYREHDSAFGLVDLKDLRVFSGDVRFVESGQIPSDAEQVGTTWLRVNADGGPDRRFRDNLEIPVVRYGQLRLESASGLREEYQVSNAKLSAAFGAALGALVGATAGAGSAQ